MLTLFAMVKKSAFDFWYIWSTFGNMENWTFLKMSKNEKSFRDLPKKWWWDHGDHKDFDRWKLCEHNFFTFSKKRDQKQKNRFLDIFKNQQNYQQKNRKKLVINIVTIYRLVSVRRCKLLWLTFSQVTLMLQNLQSLR